MVRLIEELSMNAWPSLQTELYDGWVLRFAEGYTKRSNSINLIYPSELDCEEKIAVCESVYRSRNMPVIFKLAPGPVTVSLDAMLEKRGYERLDETSVRILELGSFDGAMPEGIHIGSALDDAWFEDFFRVSENRDLAVQHTARRMLANIGHEVICARKAAGGRTVACGLGVIERGYVGVFDVIVEKNQRGLGYGRDVMNGILTAAKLRGATRSYLQVVVGNTVAENLYQKLGYRELYRYWYRVNR